MEVSSELPLIRLQGHWAMEVGRIPRQVGMGWGEVGNSTIGEHEEEERSMKNRETCWLGREVREAVPEA